MGPRADRRRRQARWIGAAGFLVALATYVTARLISPALADAVPFALLLIVMCWRPWGVFGTPEELNRV